MIQSLLQDRDFLIERESLFFQHHVQKRAPYLRDAVCDMFEPSVVSPSVLTRIILVHQNHERHLLN